MRWQNDDMEDNTVTNESDPFKRRESLKRTPPGRERSASMSDIIWQKKIGDPEASNPSKRKRAEALFDTSSTGRDEIDRVIQALVSKARVMEGFVNQTVNTKKEIKDAAADILRMSLKLERLNKDRPKVRASITECRQISSCSGTVETQTEETEVTTKEAACQTLSDEDEAVDKLRTAINEGNNVEELKKLMTDEWPREVYSKVHIVEGDILGAPKDQDLAIITSGDLKLEKGIARRYRERFGGIEELQAQGKGLGEVACLISSISVPATRDTVRDERFVWYMLAEKEPLELADTDTVYQAIYQLKEKMEHKSQAEVYVYKRDKISRRKTDAGQTQSSRLGQSKGKQARREAVIVKSNGRSYADLVRELRKDVNLNAVDVEVSKIRKTQKGDLLLEVRKGKAEDLKTAINNQMHGVQAARRTKQVVLHLNNLDSITTKEDIISALKVTLGDDVARCRVTSIRPAYGESQNATVIADTDVARLLLKKGTLLDSKTSNWILKQLDKGKFNTALQTLLKPKSIDNADQLMDTLTAACNQSMPRRANTSKRGPVYWWTQEIGELRRECLKARRAYTRKNLPEHAREIRGLNYKLARQTLRVAIKTSKSRCWKKLMEEVDDDIWGKGYRIVFKRTKLGPSLPNMSVERRRLVAEALFPSQPRVVYNTQPETPLNHFTIDELLAASEKLKAKKTPGVDCIPAEIIKIAVTEAPDIFLKVCNSALATGCFPTRWKCADLVLIPKKNRHIDTPSAYRALCVLDAAGKLLEHLILGRLVNHIESNDSLSCNQFGFRKGRSTIGAIEKNCSYRATGCSNCE
nr:unnamed protein product [Callosobruchus chinensis]